MKKLIMISLFTILVVSFLSASVEEDLEKFAEENGKGYIQPFVNAFSANLNTGLYNTAKVLKPLRFGFSLNTMAAIIPDDGKTFMAKRPEIKDPITGEYLYEPEEIETATFFGDEGKSFSLQGTDYTNLDDIEMPDGADFPAAPLFIPQINLGVIGGNEIMVRYIPKVQINDEIGKMGYYGIGLKHSVSQHLPGIIPIDLALQGAYQNFTVGDIINMNSITGNVQISKKLLMWTLYGGIGYEKTTMEVDYETETYQYNEVDNEFEMQTQEISFDLESENELRATVGFRYSLLFLKINADYSLCKYPVANLGIGLSF